MLTIARLRGSSLFIAVGFCLLASCKGKVEGDKPKPDEPALSKPAEDPALAKLQIPAPAAAPPPHATAVKEKPGEVISDDAPAAGASEDTASEPDDSDGDEEPATKSHKKKNKKKNGKAHKVHARKRASSSDDEPKDKREVKADAEDAHPDLKLKRIQFSHRIDSREPVDPEETFSAAEIDKLYAFIELSNPSKQKGKIVVTFIPPQGSASKVTLDVGEQPRWRTWAQRKSPKAVGTWKVIVRDESGKELGHRSFEVTE